MDTDDIIEQILKESNNDNFDYNESDFKVEDVLNELSQRGKTDPLESLTDTKNEVSNININSMNQNNKDSHLESPNKNPNQESSPSHKNSLSKIDLFPNLEMNTESNQAKGNPSSNNSNFNYNYTSNALSNYTNNQFEILELPDYPNPIDTINYIELDSYKENVKSFEKNFKIQTFKEKSKIKINTLEIEPQINLSREIFRKREHIISAMGAKGDKIIIGTTVGIIKVYSMSSSTLTNTIQIKEINTRVNCFDFTYDGIHLFTGYDKGFISIWDFEKDKCRLVISPNDIHKKNVIAIKIYKKENKLFHFFSSDNEGNVYINTVVDGLFKFRLTESLKFIQNTSEPTYLIKTTEFTEEEKKSYSFVEKAMNIVVMANISSIRLYLLENQIKDLFQLNKPSFIKDNYVPDTCIGLGKPPINMSVKTDNIKSQLLLTIAWGKVIYFYILPIVGGIIVEPSLLGNFVNTNPVYRVGYLSDSLIYFFDSTKFIKVLNTRQINIGDVVVDSRLKEPISSSKNSEALIDDGRLVDPEIQFQILFTDKTGVRKATYLNYILENNKHLHLLGKATIYNGKLLNWESVLSSIKKDTEEEWMDLLSTGIEIFQARMPALSDIPPEEGMRKKIIGKYLQQIISQYVIFNTGSKRTGGFLSEDSDDNIKIGQCISNTIEFCINIEAIDYLLMTIEPIFDSKDYTEIFLSKFEPFILCDKLRNFELGEEIITNIIDLYKREKNYEILSQLLVHLNIKSLVKDNLIKRIEEMGLITPLIYINMNMDNGDLFTPILKLYEMYMNATSLPNFTSYKEYFEIRRSISEIKNSKQYFGHKLLWYINWCLKGSKYPNERNLLEKNRHSKIVCRIAYWLLTQKVLNELMKFDCVNYFDILTKIFTTPSLHKMLIENAENNSEKIETMAALFNEVIKLNDIYPNSLIEYFVEECKIIQLNENESLLLDEFVASCSYLTPLSKELAIRTAGRIFISYDINNRYKTKALKNKTDDDYILLSEKLIKLFQNCKLSNEEYKQLSVDSFSTPFDTLKLYLFEQIKEYSNCLDIYLKEDSKVKNKTKRLFDMINNVLFELKADDKDKFELFKKDIFDKITKIGRVNIEKLYQLINLWFRTEKKEILISMDKDPEVQLQYIEILIKDLKVKLKENENQLTEDDPAFINYIMQTHIKLLCVLGKFKEILVYLKSSTFYPVSECLNLCLEYHVDEASIYLYQISGLHKQALELSITIFENSFYSIFNSLLRSNENFEENRYLLDLEKFKNNLECSIKVCENSKEENDDLWFILLDLLYKFTETLKDDSNIKRYQFYRDLKTLISQDVKELLEKMCNFVSIKNIIDKVTEKYKTAQFRDFKELLLNMLNSYSNLTRILDSAKILLSNSVISSENDLARFNGQGNLYYIDQCSYCNKPFNKSIKSKEKILAFGCGHLAHDNCTLKENEEIICKFCRKNEIESSIGTSTYTWKKSIIKEEDEDMIFNKNLNKSRLDSFNKDEEKRNMFAKLKGYDKKNRENRRELIMNSVNCLRDQMKLMFS